MDTLGGQNWEGSQQKHCFLERDSPCESQGRSLQGALWRGHGIFGHFLPQPNPGKHMSFLLSKW